MRKVQFQTDHYYHIYNRGVDKRNIFGDEKNFLKFLKNLRQLNNNTLKEQRDYVLRKARPERKEH